MVYRTPLSLHTEKVQLNSDECAILSFVLLEQSQQSKVRLENDTIMYPQKICEEKVF